MPVSHFLKGVSMADNQILAKVKLSMRIVSTAFDSELDDLIHAALADLGIAGVTNTTLSDPLIVRAVTTYCRMHFGEPDQYERLKASYDEQKSQLSMATGYTDYPEG